MCKSIHSCKICQKSHHTLLHVAPDENLSTQSIQSHTASEMNNNTLLMTCRVLVHSPNGLSIEARAVLDSASSASFISERLAQTLCLPRSHKRSSISGIADLTCKSNLQIVTQCTISPLMTSHEKFTINAFIMPRVTCDLPVSPVSTNGWKSLSDLPLADPDFGKPGRIDILLGVDIFVNVLLQGRRQLGPYYSPVALEIMFGWVIAGGVDMSNHNVVHHVVSMSGDDILRKFWEIENHQPDDFTLTLDERFVVEHFKANHMRDENGVFIVPLPRIIDPPLLGESRSSAVRRYMSLERSLNSKGKLNEFHAVMEEYIELGHAELVPIADLQKPDTEIFYLPMHVVLKDSSTTTKVRAVFDASAKSSSGFSLNDTLLVGPTVHSSLIDVLLKFRFHRYALTTDVSKMYRAIKLTQSDRDYHRFVWRRNPTDPLREYRMTRLTFGVSASSFAANMALKQNAMDFSLQYPMAVQRVYEAFYVDDGLTGADSIPETIHLQRQLQELFERGGFTLRKWNSNNSEILDHLPTDLKEKQPIQTIAEEDQYTKTLGIKWNSVSDTFRITVAEINHNDIITKRTLISDVSKTFDILGWFSPTIIKVKILFQRLWELKIDWDDPVPEEVRLTLSQWRSELSILSTKHIPRCYFPLEFDIKKTQLHGFSDASEDAYSAAVYFRFEDTSGKTHITLITSKTKVAPMKRLTIPRLELCGAHLLSDVLSHVKNIFQVPMCDTYAWTDSTIAIDWLNGNPRRLKTFVGNRVSHIINLIPPDRWNHVSGGDNPADCASRGLFPLALINHDMWWDGPPWLSKDPSEWPKSHVTTPINTEELRGVSLATNVRSPEPIIPLNRYSDFNHLKKTTSWVLRFVNNCRKFMSNTQQVDKSCILSVEEMEIAERYWIKLVQKTCFADEINVIKKNKLLQRESCLVSLHPFIDDKDILRLSGRISNSNLHYEQIHPIILHGKHQITKMIIRAEHLRLLHAGPSLLSASINLRFHIIGGKRIIRDITRACVICRRQSVRPQPQIMGQLPMERVTPGLVFERVGIDFAGPIYVKYGYVRKPTIVKSYVCVFVSLNVKAVHLELVSDLTSEAFIACLRRFVARRGKPTDIWSDHGTNFVSANRELKEFIKFLNERKNVKKISEFCTSQKINWKFIPERAPHFGGLWEAAVKSFKAHLKKVTLNVRLTFEEACTLMAQIEACLNSRPLVALSSIDDHVDALTPGHFLIGKPLEALPDSSQSFQSVSLLRRWHLVQSMIRHFWTRWSSEYVCSLRKYVKWRNPQKNITVGDIVVLQEDNLIPTKWPLARIVNVHPGADEIVRVVSVKTSRGIYKRPVTKVALLLPHDID